MPPAFPRGALPWVAPILLCAVALNQLRLVHSASLSPWKGGGFGMFATVDSPGARFLRIDLVGRDREIPVAVPESLRSRLQEIRAIPTRERADALARALAEGTWVRLRMQSAVAYYEAAWGTPEGARVGRGDREVGDGRRGEADFDDLDFVRMLGEGEEPAPDDVEVVFSGVRLEVWRYRFDAVGTALSAGRLLRVTAARAGSGGPP